MFEVKFFGHKRWNIFFKLVAKHLWAFLSSVISDMNLDTDSFIAFKSQHRNECLWELKLQLPEWMSLGRRAIGHRVPAINQPDSPLSRRRGTKQKYCDSEQDKNTA